jgi:uncharacterized membrane protein YebE (DUF533 family)
MPSPTPDVVAHGEGTPPATVVPADVLRVIRLSISAAHADGAFTRAERDAILAQATAVGAGALIAGDLDRPPALRALVAGVEDPAQRQRLYTIAFAIVRADEAVTSVERTYLRHLADALRLDDDIVAELERDAAAGIAAGDREGSPTR